MSGFNRTQRQRQCEVCGQNFWAKVIKGVRQTACSPECKRQAHLKAAAKGNGKSFALSGEQPRDVVPQMVDPATLFENPENGRLLPLSQGLWAIVDDGPDYEKASQHKWSAAKNRWRSYAHRNVRGGGRNTTITLHNFLFGDADKFVVRHENGNSLDNRRANIKIRTIVIDKVCKHCGESFQSKIRSTGEYEVFCSRPCWDAYQKKSGKSPKEARCIQCGEVKKLRCNRTFCSIECKKVYLKNVGPKACKECGQTKEAWEFACQVTWAKGFSLKGSCTKCKSKRSNIKRTDESRINNQLQYHYDKDIEWRRRTLEVQDYRCALCGEKFVESKGRTGKDKKYRPVVDHSHDGDKHVRAIIHHKCNIGIGHLDDSIAKLRMAIAYLEKYGE